MFGIVLFTNPSKFDVESREPLPENDPTTLKAVWRDTPDLPPSHDHKHVH